MRVSDQDRAALRRLAEQYREMAELPVHRETAGLWRRLNRLEPVRPLVLIYQIPWHELATDSELRMTCEDTFCRQIEQELRRTLYQWRHMPGDMVLDETLFCPMVIRDSGFGIEQSGRHFEVMPGGIEAQHFEPQIRDETDLERIQLPTVACDREETERRFEAMREVFDGIIPVAKRGITRLSFAPWDELIRWYGIERAMTDMLMNPGLVHAAMDRLVTAYLHRLDQAERQGLLSGNTGNLRVGTGGLGFTDELAGPREDPATARTDGMWGYAMAQIFSEVSPAMHEEFALRHELRWLSRFGLNYYGCCEPLHAKIPILRQVPRLRKVSISPWADAAAAAERGVGTDFVCSLKPNPAILAESTWEPARARAALERSLEAVGGGAVEIILKDISTVRKDPGRLWEWAEMARETAESYG